MSAAAGALVGGAAGTGALLIVARLMAMRRADFDARVMAYLRDLPQLATDRPADPATTQLQLVLGR